MTGGATGGAGWFARLDPGETEEVVSLLAEDVMGIEGVCDVAEQSPDPMVETSLISLTHPEDELPNESKANRVRKR